MGILASSRSNYVAVLQGIPGRGGLKGDYPVCGISFWYHISGNATLNLTLLTQTQSHTSVTIESLWTGNGHSTGGKSSWSYAEVYDADVMVKVGHFEFHAVMYDTSDIVTVALDDITYIRCSGKCVLVYGR